MKWLELKDASKSHQVTVTNIIGQQREITAGRVVGMKLNTLGLIAT